MRKTTVLAWFLILVVIALVVITVLAFDIGRNDSEVVSTDSTSSTGSEQGSSLQATATSSAVSGTATSSKSGDITVTSPISNSIISSPLTITGNAKNSWFFEAVFPIKLVDSKGKTLVTTEAKAGTDWTTPGMVPFTATLVFTTASTTATTGTIVFMNDNPSGDPARDLSFKIPVSFVTNSVSQ